MPDSTYAPQSPDLSSFHSSSTPPQAQTSSYTPRSPNLRAFATNSSYQHPYRGSGGLGLGHDELQLLPTSKYPIPQPRSEQKQHQQGLQPPQHRYSRYDPPQDSYQPATPTAPYHSRYQPPAVANSPAPAVHVSQIQQQSVRPAQAPASVAAAAPAPLKLDGDSESRPTDMVGRGRRQAANKADSSSNTTSPSTAGPSHASEVKTKFPVARIKRIMQADEEVGKVAQVTPVAVSKALELFMISLVTKSADIAKAANSKRVTAQHLKKAIAADDQFDFLTDIVSRVVDGPSDSTAAAAKRAKDDDDSDDDDHKAVKKAKGRRRKTE